MEGIKLSRFSLGRELDVLGNKAFELGVRSKCRREKRIQFKKILFSLIGPVVHIWYWPEDYMSCFNLRIDVDYPISKFYKKNKIMRALIEFLNKVDVPCSLFINHVFSRQNKHLLKNINVEKHDIETHGCTKDMPHRHYCYLLDALKEPMLEKMLLLSVVDKGKVFAPPCEQANSTVLRLCEKLGIRFLSAGYLGRDDIPHKIVLDREYDVFNIPTVAKEFWPRFEDMHFNNEFKEVVKDNSLYSVYFHPISLLNKKDRKKINSFLNSVLNEKKQNKLWIATQKEIAEWWERRDKIKFISGKICVNDDVIEQARIAYWTPRGIKIHKIT